MLAKGADVSVVVVTYNSEWKKLKHTLKSILEQKNTSIEIIVADDGSSCRWDAEIVAYMEERAFFQYKIVNQKINKGTVKNIENALKYVTGRYVKTFSPGDFLYNDHVLAKWVDYMDKTNSRVSFGEAVYYLGNVIFPSKGNPISKEIFSNRFKRRSQFVDYLLANDTILGAALLMETSIIKKYISLIAGKIKYAEDYMLRIMIFDGLPISYYPEKVIWYEYGTGISSSGNDVWVDRLHKDFDMCNAIIVDSEYEVDKIAYTYKRFLKKNIYFSLLRKIYKCFIFPDVFYWRLKNKFTKENMPDNLDRTFLDNVLQES